MINYADYDFYSKTYKGTLSEDLFNSLIPKASRELDKSVNKELKEVDITDRVKFVACELVDFLEVNNVGKEKLSSVSIDGVSKNYGTKTVSDLKHEKSNILNGLPIELTRYL